MSKNSYVRVGSNSFRRFIIDVILAKHEIDGLDILNIDARMYLGKGANVMRIATTITILLAGIGSLLSTPAPAQVPECAVPNTLVNGQVADATDLMENFSAVTDCVESARGDAVTHEGTPATGEIAVFTSPTAVTGGNLTGDVTTSGSTATQLSPSGVTPGTYVNPTLVVDSKGRIASATNGVSGGGSSTLGWTELTLVNPGAEAGNTSGWTMVGGGFTATTANPVNHTFNPIEGLNSFVASPNADPQMYQDYDISTFASAVDLGAIRIMIEASAADTFTTGERPIIFALFLNASGSQLSRVISDDPIQTIGSGQWRHLSAEGRVPKNARTIRIYLWANRVNGTQNNVAFDDVRAFISGF